MKIRPLHDRILVKRIEVEETTKGGIIIPDTAQEKPVEGFGALARTIGGGGHTTAMCDGGFPTALLTLCYCRGRCS